MNYIYIYIYRWLLDFCFGDEQHARFVPVHERAIAMDMTKMKIEKKGLSVWIMLCRDLHYFHYSNITNPKEEKVRM